MYQEEVPASTRGLNNSVACSLSRTLVWRQGRCYNGSTCTRELCCNECNPLDVLMPIIRRIAQFCESSSGTILVINIETSPYQMKVLSALSLRAGASHSDHLARSRILATPVQCVLLQSCTTPSRTTQSLAYPEVDSFRVNVARRHCTTNDCN